MPIENGDFCENGYKAIEGLDALIKEPQRDPTFFRFLSNYKIWEDAGAPDGLSDMFTFFDDPADSNRALVAGDTSQGNEEGRVRENHCSAHRDFVIEGTPISEYFAERAAEADASVFADGVAAERSLTDFESALRGFMQGDPLNAKSRGLLNGAVFVYRKPPSTEFTGGDNNVSVDDEEFVVIPGKFVTNGLFRRNLRDPFWRGVYESINDASVATGMKSINIDLALQLRLGMRGTSSPFPSQPVGSGVVIFGGE